MNQPASREQHLRDILCDIGRRVWQREYVAANDGNFSVRLSPGEILCTPTMVSKGFMQPEELPLLSPAGSHLRGPKPATSEIKMHLEIYRRRPDVQAVVHVHPPHATAFAIARHPIPKCVLPEVELFLGEIPVAPYETPGTQSFAETLVPYLQHYNAFLLASHGAVTVGSDPLEAYYRMETLDQYCRILLLALQLGGWQSLEPERVRELWAFREKLGKPDRRTSLADCEICKPGVDAAPPQAPLHAELISEITRRVQERLRQQP